MNKKLIRNYQQENHGVLFGKIPISMSISRLGVYLLGPSLAISIQAQAQMGTCYVRYDHDAAGNRTAKYWYCCCLEPGFTASDSSMAPKAYMEPTLLETLELQLTPNPATAFLSVSVSSPMDAAMVEIYDLHGRQVATSSFSGITMNIDLHKLASGPYVLRLTKNREMLVKQFMVQREP